MRRLALVVSPRSARFGLHHGRNTRASRRRPPSATRACSHPRARRGAPARRSRAPPAPGLAPRPPQLSRFTDAASSASCVDSPWSHPHSLRAWGPCSRARASASATVQVHGRRVVGLMRRLALVASPFASRMGPLLPGSRLGLRNCPGSRTPHRRPHASTRLGRIPIRFAHGAPAPGLAPLVRAFPVGTHADVDHQRHRELRDAGHVTRQLRTHARFLVRRHLQHQLVVHLQHEARVHVLTVEP